MGEDRVIDYSRLQRREIQMDLFGRELILPRDRARALHVEAGMTASAIAQRLGAPFEVVAQQLLDALLIPVIEIDTARPAQPPAPPNPSQEAAAAHRGGPFLLEAGPGTGKTKTLVARVAGLVAAGVDPRSILVLTFSNKAAGELADRIASADADAAAAMWIGTFHAFGLDLIRRYHDELGFEREPRLMDRSEAIAALETEYLGLGLMHHQDIWNPARKLKDMLAAVSRAKDEVADAERFAELARSMVDAAKNPDAREAGERCAEVARVYRRYEEIKRASCAIDFGDLVSLPVTLLEKRRDIARDLQDRYSHVLVDEYQDVNRSSVRLLRLLRRGGQGLWAVGDARQAIYRFRGASSHNMARFASHYFPGGTVGRLDVNYRSSKEIVDAFSSFASGMAAGIGDAMLEAHRGPNGNPPRHVTFGSNQDEAAALAAEIRRLEPETGFSRQAVLCPGNERLGRMGRELERRGIPVLYLGSLFERPEVKDLLALLSLLFDRRAAALVRGFVLPGLPRGPSLAGAAAIVGHLADAPEPLIWAKPAAMLPGIANADRLALGEIAALLKGFGPEDRPWPVLARILLDRTRVAAMIHEATSVAETAMGLAIWQLMGFVRLDQRGAGLPIQRLLDAIRRLVMLADERDLRQLPAAAQGIDAVRLMTIHGSKGLEFEAVHVMGANRGAMPSAARRPACPVPDGMIEGATGGTLEATRADHVLEQECLFYVATTRARDHLVLFSATRDAGGRNRAPSDFLGRLGAIETVVAAPPTEPARDPELEPLPISIGPPLTVTAAQLDLYSRCPRRFLYTHVLGTGGRRTPSALSLMHDVVRAVISEIAATDPGTDCEVRAEAALDRHWARSELAAETFALHRDIAGVLVARFASSRSSGARLDLTELHADLPGGSVEATADDVVEVGGRRVARMIRTGHAHSKSGDTLSEVAFQLAAQASTPACEAEIVHLADALTFRIAFDGTKLENRRLKLAAVFEGMGSGHFMPERSEFTCPTCPAFFYCGPVATGALEKKPFP